MELNAKNGGNGEAWLALASGLPGLRHATLSPTCGYELWSRPIDQFDGLQYSGWCRATLDRQATCVAKDSAKPLGLAQESRAGSEFGWLGLGIRVFVLAPRSGLLHTTIPPGFTMALTIAWTSGDNRLNPRCGPM